MEEEESGGWVSTSVKFSCLVVHFSVNLIHLVRMNEILVVSNFTFVFLYFYYRTHHTFVSIGV